MKIKITETESFLELPEGWECEIKKTYSKSWSCTCTFGEGYHANLSVREEHKSRTEATILAFRKACIIADAIKDFEA